MNVSKFEFDEGRTLGSMNRSEYSALMSLIGTLAWQIKKDQNVDMKEARKEAAQEIGASLLPPVGGAELEQAIGQARQRLFKAERKAGVERAREKREAEKASRKEEAARLKAVQITRTTAVKPAGMRRLANGTLERFDIPLVKQDSSEEATKSKKAVTRLYREWVEQYDWVPLDVALAHFVGKTPEAFSFARNLLVKEGYAFRRYDRVWNVVARPEEKKYSEKEVRQLMNELLSKYNGGK